RRVLFRSPCKLGIIRGDVPVGFFYLWDLGELSGQISFFGRSNGNSGAFRVFLFRDNFNPVAGGFMPKTTKHWVTVFGQVSANVEGDGFIGRRKLLVGCIWCFSRCRGNGSS